LQTPVSDRGLPAKQPTAGALDKDNTANIETVPQPAYPEDLYEGVEIIHEAIDAATDSKSDPLIGTKPYVLELEEESSTLRAKEWSNLFAGVGGSADNANDDSTLGKRRKAAETLSAGEKDDDESSTLGKDTKINLASVVSNPSEPRASPKVEVPAPAFTYNPEEDDDDEVMTWAVQMEPTKPAASPAQTSKQTLGPATSLARRDSQDSVSSVSRQDRPSLRVQTDIAGKVPSTASTSKQPAVQDVIQSATVSKRTISPKSAKQRNRQHSSNASSSPWEEGCNAARKHLQNSKDTSEDSKTSPSMTRRISFNNNAWAYRPPVEQVYENLEEFFPGHDLDKPIIDAGISGPSSAISSPSSEQTGFLISGSGKGSESTSANPVVATQATSHQAALPSHVQPEAGRRFNQNRKSMRMVAADRQSRMKRGESAAKAASANAGATEKADKEKTAEKLARRKSTKVWGRRIQEVTSAEADALASAKESPADRGERE
jgi:mitogen-activated protein kinase kinase kinase